jgi:Fe-S-cluster-containing hydrogenase component 2
MTEQRPDTATGLSTGTPNGQARAVALTAARQAGRHPTGIVSYQSAGRLLLVGSAAAIREARTVLDNHAGISCTGLVTDATDTPPEVTGYLGRFELQGPAGEPQVYDLVLDLGSPPLLHAEVLPPGYYAPDGDPDALQAALDELPGLTGEFEKPQYFSYDPAICAHGRSGITACTRCLDTCPTAAITSLGDTIEVNPNLCQGAGSCATACPSGAIGYSYPRLSDTLQQLHQLLQAYHDAGGTDAVVLFHDSEAGRDAIRQVAARLPGRVIPVEVEELGSVGMDTWLATLAYGAAAIALLATPRLPGSVLKESALQLDVAGQMLAGLGYPAAVLQLLQSDDPGLIERLGASPATGGRRAAGFAALDEKRTVIRLAVDHLHAQARAQRALVSLPAGAPCAWPVFRNAPRMPWRPVTRVRNCCLSRPTVFSAACAAGPARRMRSRPRRATCLIPGNAINAGYCMKRNPSCASVVASPLPPARSSRRSRRK